MATILLRRSFIFILLFFFTFLDTEAKTLRLSYREKNDPLAVFTWDTFDNGKLIIKYYPNPAKDFITFEFDKNLATNTRLVVYNFTGRKMSEIQIANLKTTLNLSEYYRGLYLFQLISTKGIILESGKFQVLK